MIILTKNTNWEQLTKEEQDMIKQAEKAEEEELKLILSKKKTVEKYIRDTQLSLKKSPNKAIEQKLKKVIARYNELSSDLQRRIEFKNNFKNM